MFNSLFSISKNSKAFIETIMPYIRSPFQVVLTQVHSAMLGNGLYNTIIRDKGGTELWFYNTFSESLKATINRFFKQKDLHSITFKEVLLGLEFEIKEELLTDEEKNYIETPMRIHTLN